MYFRKCFLNNPDLKKLLYLQIVQILHLFDPANNCPNCYSK